MTWREYSLLGFLALAAIWIGRDLRRLRPCSVARQIQKRIAETGKHQPSALGRQLGRILQ